MAIAADRYDALAEGFAGALIGPDDESFDQARRCHNGLVDKRPALIALSLMRGVDVDPRERVARVQGGALWSDVNRETALHGLAVTGGAISTTGVGGYTLGGGLGWLMGMCGLATDNVLEAEALLGMPFEQIVDLWAELGARQGRLAARALSALEHVR